MSTQTPPPYNVLQKPERKGLKVNYAEHLKPVSEEIDESGGSTKFFMTYVTEAGKECRIQTTKELWKRIHGPTSEKHPHAGLDMKVDLIFRILSKPATAKTPEKAVGLDIMPKHLYKRGMIPEKYEGLEDITLKVNQKTGDIEVTASPPKLTKNALEVVLKAVDALSEIQPGDNIAKKFEVSMVAGNTLTISPVF